MRRLNRWTAALPALAAALGLVQDVIPAPAAAPPAYPASQPAAAAAPQLVAATQSATTATPATVASTQPASAPTTAPAGRLANVVVTAELDQARARIAPALGAVTYTMGPEQIQNTPEGENASFQQVLLRMPGVVMDSFGQEHVRGEHGNLTYRINGVLLPDPLTGFGQEIDTHLIDSVSLIDGSLPAQFGFRTAGVIDVTTKSGANLSGGSLSVYGGSYDTVDSEFEYGGTGGPWDYFVGTSQKHNNLGIENPTSSSDPIHDITDQERAFAYLAYRFDDTSRLSLLVNASYADFEIPNVPGQTPGFNLVGNPTEASADLNENQNEQQYYTAVSYQKSSDELSMQASLFSQYGQIYFTPDNVGDLLYQGVAAKVFNSFLTNGLQFDSSYILNDWHTLRFGMLTDYTVEKLGTDTQVFPQDPANPGVQTSDLPFLISDQSRNDAWMTGFYGQDEWRLTRSLTLNYGLRYDRFDSNFDDESQFSPRVNLVWKIDQDTTAHAGYARYFVPPPVQYVAPGIIQQFAATTNNTTGTLQDDPPKVERSNYFDVGASRQIIKPWKVDVDAYYKQATNLIDLGQFGNAVILSPYNYASAVVYGAEFSTSWKQGGFSTFANLAYNVAKAHDIVSNQYQFTPDDLAYIQNNNIHLDHDSEYTASAGVSYTWAHDRVYVDMLYGSGLRSGADNTQTEPMYYPVNVGYEHVFHFAGNSHMDMRLRFDIINLFDLSYQIRSGSGLGVFAPQYGQRQSFLAGLTFDF